MRNTHPLLASRRWPDLTALTVVLIVLLGVFVPTRASLVELAIAGVFVLACFGKTLHCAVSTWRQTTSVRRLELAGALVLSLAGLWTLSSSSNVYGPLTLGLSAWVLAEVGRGRAVAPAQRVVLAGLLVASILQVLDHWILWTQRCADLLRVISHELLHKGLTPIQHGYSSAGGDAFVFVALCVVAHRVRGGLRSQRWPSIGWDVGLLLGAGFLLLTGRQELGVLGLAAACRPFLWVSTPGRNLAEDGAAPAASRSRLLPNRALAPIAGGMTAVGLFLGSWLPEGRAVPGAQVAFLPGHYSTDLPDLEDPQVLEGVPIGGFVQSLEHQAQVTMLESGVTTESLAEVDCLVVCNLDHQLAARELEAVHDFVRNGGSLLLFGDHTDLFGQMGTTEPLLAPFGIRLRFDSAMPPGGWYRLLDARWHPATAQLKDASDIQISVGASLDLSGRAQPLLVAREGWSDLGNHQNAAAGYLGNWAFDGGHERLGDLILAATSDYGRGRVVVFGDTALLQGASYAVSAPFLESMVAWLSSSDSHSSWTWILSAGVLLTAFGLPLLLVASMRVGPVSGAFLSAGLVLLTYLLPAWNADRSAWRLGAPGPRAWFLTDSGGELTFDTLGPNSISGATDALLALGLQPRVQRGEQLPDLRLGDVVLLPARRGPSQNVDRRLEEACRAGVVVLELLSPQDQISLRARMDRLGLQVTSEPLGRCPTISPVGDGLLPRFKQAYAMVVDPEIADVRSSVECFGKTVLASRPLGQGHWVFIADAEFLSDGNFKYNEAPERDSWVFLSHLIKGDIL